MGLEWLFIDSRMGKCCAQQQQRLNAEQEDFVTKVIKWPLLWAVDYPRAGTLDPAIKLI